MGMSNSSSKKKEDESNKITQKRNGESRQNENKVEIIKEADLGAGTPIIKNESDELYSYEPALCKIEFETLKDGKKVKGFGTGFFCEITMKIFLSKKLYLLIIML